MWKSTSVPNVLMFLKRIFFTICSHSKQLPGLFLTCFGFFFTGDRRWPAPPAGSSYTWTARCSGWTRCWLRWAPRASGAPASLRDSLRPLIPCAPRLLVRDWKHRDENNDTQTERWWDPTLLFSYSSSPPPVVRSTFYTHFVCGRRGQVH